MRTAPGCRVAAAMSLLLPGAIAPGMPDRQRLGWVLRHSLFFTQPKCDFFGTVCCPSSCSYALLLLGVVSSGGQGSLDTPCFKCCCADITIVSAGWVYDYNTISC